MIVVILGFFSDALLSLHRVQRTTDSESIYVPTSISSMPCVDSDRCPVDSSGS